MSCEPAQAELSERTLPSSASASQKRTIRQLKLKNFLSFGPEGETVELQGLNILVGPNGSGKSNLVEAIALLRATAGDLRGVIRRGGGAREWIWKGRPDDPARLEAVVENPAGNLPLRHGLSFQAQDQGFELDDEWIENEKPFSGKKEPYFYYHFQQGRPVLNVVSGKRKFKRDLKREDVERDASILSQRKDPDAYPEITYLSDSYERISQIWD